MPKGNIIVTDGDGLDDAAVELVFQIIGGNVIQLRGLRRMTQTDLAEKAGTVRSTINRLENGQGCSLENLIKVADALGVPPADLFITKQDEERISALQIKVVDRLAEILGIKPLK